jgi:malonate-semialdehyde dehydrogenase (acetylating)/methylmalonate-semialdehyde dehydrogenase
MAASVLLLVEGSEHILDDVVARASRLRLGKDMGAIISRESLTKLEGAIARAEKARFKIRINGTLDTAKNGLDPIFSSGNWLGPTIIDLAKANSEAACDELFGPVLTVIRCRNLSEAIAIENSSQYGNACSVFTQNGAVGEEVARRSRVGMVGINVGVPVPREPFSFGGTGISKFGAGDITGESALNFWADLRKITVKWQISGEQNWMS